MGDQAMQITVAHRVPIELAQWIAERAEQLGITKSEVLRRALEAARAAATTTEGQAA